MALAKRISPCLDVTNGRVVKGINFLELRDAGDPVEIAKRYDDQGADELTFLDITASSDNRGLILHIIEQVASQVFIPLTVGGGVREVEDVRHLLNAGADKVSINTTAVLNPQVVQDAAARFGRWIRGVALPVWCDAGADAEYGFVERLGFDGGVAQAGFLRCRLLARQVAVYAQGSRPWSIRCSRTSSKTAAYGPTTETTR